MFVQGRVFPPGRALGDSTDINRVVIAPNFFETMGTPRGRPQFHRIRSWQGAEGCRDQPGGRAKVLPNENPIGRRFGNSPETSSDVEIVGVLRMFATTAFASRPRRRSMFPTCSAGLTA
jgi:hypothetical protein